MPDLDSQQYGVNVSYKEELLSKTGIQLHRNIHSGNDFHSHTCSRYREFRTPEGLNTARFSHYALLVRTGLQNDSSFFSTKTNKK